jgi:hypothetical protein
MVHFVISVVPKDTNQPSTKLSKAHNVVSYNHDQGRQLYNGALCHIFRPKDTNQPSAESSNDPSHELGPFPPQATG